MFERIKDRLQRDVVDQQFRNLTQGIAAVVTERPSRRSRT